MPSSAANGFGQQTVDTGEWVMVFDASGYFNGSVRSLIAKSLSTSVENVAVFPQYDDANEPDELDEGFPLESGQSVELSAANNDRGRIVALWAKSDDATIGWAVTIP